MARRSPSCPPTPDGIPDSCERPATTEYTHPFALESDPFAGPARKSAERRLDRLRLTKGQQIAYLFDFGDAWRVRLTLRAITAADAGDYPRLLDAVGDAPPQYPDYGDEEDAA
jgi:hypothetical protein